MMGAANYVVDLIFGRWRSQILYAGVELGVFEHLVEGEAGSAATLAPEIEADPDRLYRLMRALASIGLLAEDAQGGFRLTEAGALLREDHPNSLRAITLLEDEPHFAKLFDIHMMCATSGRERTLAELADLLTQGGWRFDATHQAPGALQSVVAGAAAGKW